MLAFRAFLSAALVALVLAALACSGSAPVPDASPSLSRPPATRPSASTNAPRPATSAPSAEPALPSATAPSGYDPNDNMYLLWSRAGHPIDDTLVALADAEANHDRSQVPVILEALRFMRPDASEYAVRTVASLTGSDFTFGLREWREMGEWLGRNLQEYPPPSRYPEWKIHVLSQIDPAMAALLQPAVEHSPVNLTEIMWGGVRVDGIPPLENAPYILAEQATWLWPDDRVFGVSINGEHRAYPLRIMNAHELANDVLGGEPISLVY